MNAYHVNITRSAQQDLMGVYSYITQILKEPITAKALYQTIKSEILSLSSMPHRYAIVPESPYCEMGMRMLSVKNYIIFYLINEEHRIVTIVRVLYGRREWRGLLGV